MVATLPHMMKHVALTGLFCFSILLLKAQTLENIPLLTVTGEAAIKAVPDQAVIAVRIQRRVEIASLTTVSDAFLFSKEQTDIKFIGSDNNEILTTVIETSINDQSALFIREFIITVKDLRDLTKILMELLRHNFTNIYYISYRLSNLSQLKENAMKQAISNARSAAENYARELGQTIGTAHLVKEEPVQVNNWYVEKFRPDIHEMIGSNYIFNPGYITIPCRVTVSFNLNQ